MEHDQHWLGRITNARLAWHNQITVRKRSTCHLILVWRYWIRCRMRVKFLVQGLVVLQIASTSMETQDTHKTSLLFKRLATVLMFSIWACWKTHINVKNQYRRVCTDRQLALMNFSIEAGILLWGDVYVHVMNLVHTMYRRVHTCLYLPLVLDTKVYPSFPTAQFRWPQ